MAQTEIGEFVRRLRDGLGLSGARLAELSGVPQPLLNRVERGERQPTDEVLTKLAPVLGVPVEELKREALKDRLAPAELEAAAEIALEGATDDQLADVIVKVHFRAKAIPPEKRAAVLKDLAAYIKAIDDNWDDL